MVVKNVVLCIWVLLHHPNPAKPNVDLYHYFVPSQHLSIAYLKKKSKGITNGSKGRKINFHNSTLK